MNTKPRIAADYTTRKAYQNDYRKNNRAAINQRKRAWRAAKKLKERNPVDSGA